MTHATGGPSRTEADPRKLEAARQLLDHLIETNRVVLFLEGDRIAAQCAHSAQAVRLLDKHGTPFTTFDVLADPVVARVLSDKTGWVTLPQLFVDQRFVGGCEAMVALEQLGKLGTVLSGEPASTPAPAEA